MKTLIRVMVLVFVLVLFSGCAAVTGYPKMSYNIKQELTALQPYNSADIIQQYNNAPDKRAFRDEIVYARKRAIDLHFALFQKAVYRQTAVRNIGVDWAVLGLSGATAVTTVSGTQQILGAISGGLTGAQGKVSERLFFNNTIPVIFSKMEAQRKVILANITTGLSKKVEEYPLMHALNDLDDYYKAGTIPEALNGIVTTSGEQAAAAKKTIEDALKAKSEALK